MPLENIPYLHEEMEIPSANSRYPTLGIEYKRSSYSIRYSPTLTRIGKSYYDLKRDIPGGLRMSTAAEELAIQLGLERSGQDPRKAKVFNDLFGRNDSGWFAWQWTETGLRIPKGYKAHKFEKDSHGRKYWPRIVLVGDQEVGEVFIPEAVGRVVVEWDDFFGVPKVTSDKAEDWQYDNYTTHFFFETNTKRKDSRTGRYDIAIARGSGWYHPGQDACLRVIAYSGRCGAGPDVGFRRVQGSLPEIEKEHRIN